jgi:lysophospholipase L1-like esterase
MNRLSGRRLVLKSLYLISFPTLMSFRPKVNGSKAGSFFSNSGENDKEKIALLLKGKNSLIWVFTGDSITHGAKHTHGYRSYPEIFSERIRWELGRVRDLIINTGISGNTSRNILDDFEWRVSQFKPDVVSIMIGTNDCANDRVPLDAYEKNMIGLVKKFRSLGAIPILHTPNPIIEALDPSRASLERYVKVIKNIAEKEQVILVDNYGYWCEEIQKSNGVKVYKEWLNDPLHPDGNGHSEIARLMFKSLGIFDPEAPTCGGVYYEGEH